MEKIKTWLNKPLLKSNAKPNIGVTILIIIGLVLLYPLCKSFKKKK